MSVDKLSLALVRATLKRFPAFRFNAKRMASVALMPRNKASLALIELARLGNAQRVGSGLYVFKS